MRRQTVAAIAVLPLALAAFAGCGANTTAEAAGHTAPTDSVPAGVAEQYEVLAEELAEKGQTVKSGEWTVNLITEAAEPWHEVHGAGHSQFREPAAGETNHIEIIPVETATGRIIPDVPIAVEVLDAENKVVQKLDLNFYYSTFFHYANNFSIPEAGSYTIRATLGVPPFPRHGEADEVAPLSDGATVEFEDVELGSK